MGNLDTGQTDKNTKNYHGRGDLTRRVKMKVSDGEDVTESYKFFVDPLGGLSGDSGEKICLAFDVSSRNGKVYSVLPTGPWDTQGVKREQLWDSEKSNPQIITIALEVEGDLNDMLCRIRTFINDPNGCWQMDTRRTSIRDDTEQVRYLAPFRNMLIPHSLCQGQVSCNRGVPDHVTYLLRRNRPPLSTPV